ncbi:hypothetical protein [Nocardia cyriacigeorgica]|uniref:hypothetical protein n=1 Tax=Nocardia cyriacigeorgica TaxID=135487 RepID=UPI0013CFB758|nr:hypothetical protein [Nocardia cyriacigeorgica]NEW29216.1 hypothetical protein [Nocardia cyriacigeorgica]
MGANQRPAATGFARITMHPGDIEKTPRPGAQQRLGVSSAGTHPENGGNFPPLEVPRYLVEGLREGAAAVLAANR